MAIDNYKPKKDRRWFKNQGGGMSTMVRVNVALSPHELRYLETTTAGDRTQPMTIADKLFHLCKEALDREMIRAGVICE